MLNKAHLSTFANLQTPFYYYDMVLLEKTLSIFTKLLKEHNLSAHYALKANANERILKKMVRYGLGADCVSGNEVALAIKSGFPSSSVVYAGVGKSDHEINLALVNSIFSFNCESIAEMEVINSLASNKNIVANISLRINPEVDAHTHRYITTGTKEDKFGINIVHLDLVINKLKELKNLKLIGLHFHVGSQVTDLNVFTQLAIKVNEIQRWFHDHRIIIENLNLGGGLGVDYKDPDTNPIPNFEGYIKSLMSELEIKENQKVHLEPGRALVAQAGSLITKALYIKQGVEKRFVILDAGMNDLIRPALYEAKHKIQNLTSSLTPQIYDVAGPICESSDVFGKDLMLPESSRGDLFAIRSAGAYGQVMAMRYNQKDIAKEYYSDLL